MIFCLLADFNVICEKILIKFTGSGGAGVGGALASEHFNLSKVFNFSEF